MLEAWHAFACVGGASFVRHCCKRAVDLNVLQAWRCAAGVWSAIRCAHSCGHHWCHLGAAADVRVRTHVHQQRPSSSATRHAQPWPPPPLQSLGCRPPWPGLPRLARAAARTRAAGLQTRASVQRHAAQHSTAHVVSSAKQPPPCWRRRHISIRAHTPAAPFALTTRAATYTHTHRATRQRTWQAHLLRLGREQLPHSHGIIHHTPLVQQAGLRAAGGAREHRGSQHMQCSAADGPCGRLASRGVWAAANTACVR
jgi:hypothetical protein